MVNKPFPIEHVRPTGGTFRGSPHDYSITITLAAFELDGESHDAEIILEGIGIPDGSAAALANKQFAFPQIQKMATSMVPYISAMSTTL